MADDFDYKFLDFIACEFIRVFRGEGETRNEQIQDSLRKAQSLMNGAEQMVFSVKRSAPHLIDGGANDQPVSGTGYHKTKTDN